MDSSGDWALSCLLHDSYLLLVTFRFSTLGHYFSELIEADYKTTSNISVIFACNFPLGWQICSLKKVYSQPSKSVGSVSADSTNYRLKLFREKNFQKISEAKLEFVVYQQLLAYLGSIEDLAPDHCVK